jgi:hypothetical protein
MTVKISKTNLEVTSSLMSGPTISKTNLQVTSRPSLFVILTKTNLSVTSGLANDNRRMSFM